MNGFKYKESREMDLYQFVNSRDIREHLKKINYQFSTLEAAWLVFQADVTLEEKHAAWKEIIDTMPDCEMEERHWTCPRASLYEYLKDMMAEQQSHLKVMQKPENDYYYMLRFKEKDDWYNDDNVFRTYEEVLSYASRNFSEDWCQAWRIIRRRYGEKPRYFEETMRPDGTLLGISLWGETTTEEDRNSDQNLLGLWFDFPTPFKKGDIIWNPKRPDGFCGGPFVTLGVGTDGLKESVIQSMRNGGDNSDMCASGYFVEEDSGYVYREVTDNYMDMEFYREELTDGYRTLKSFSSFVKGEIDEVLLAQAYHVICQEQTMKESRPYAFTEEGLALAGIGEEKKKR